MKKLSIDEVNDMIGTGDKLKANPGRAAELLEDQAYIRRDSTDEKEQIERAIYKGVRNTIVEPLLALLDKGKK